ncbi:hypothetical protein SAMN02745146_3117 [Hymenobacter daecheongensis DSM 21074]|uniref:DUF6799 domain-containing protein n=1 Tax=Hymenobacter daecheongensis DSM 21074 TaxID=1121955 RepID=A0A1M6J6H3_9BACT|nr:DUF6799 domain-containing protein [Hymenobacter daecheongensis]SHJ42313.1 hypothetical protein SAMN02745146_3117 [Hymenobacter daecheongensis DSM 21074]
MLFYFRFPLAFALLSLSTGLSSFAQSRSNNDGFQRRDGIMYRIRNGEKRPMAHDVHLPNGRTITRDGFVVEASGQRTELPEGKGCTLLGTPTSVVVAPGGQLALASPAVARPSAATPAVMRYEAGVLEQLFSRRGRGHKGWGYYKKHGKGKHKKDD